VNQHIHASMLYMGSYSLQHGTGITVTIGKNKNFQKNLPWLRDAAVKQG